MEPRTNNNYHQIILNGLLKEECNGGSPARNASSPAMMDANKSPKKKSRFGNDSSESGCDSPTPLSPLSPLTPLSPTSISSRHMVTAFQATNISSPNINKLRHSISSSSDHTCPSSFSPMSSSQQQMQQLQVPQQSVHHVHHHHNSDDECDECDDEYDDEYDYDESEDEDFYLDAMRAAAASAAANGQTPNPYAFHSNFEEMQELRNKQQQATNKPLLKAALSSPNSRGVNSATSTPTHSPKSHIGTPSRPFPTLDYKIKSESVKQNADGTYSCPYETCNKTIKGNKGNLSSHLRWHRRLDAEAGEARGPGSLEDGEEEEFTTPLKPSQRGVQLRNQMIHYGLNLFRQDNQGKYLCFFEGCALRMLTNFSRHIAKHERKGDKIKEELLQHVPRSIHHTRPIPSSTMSSPPSLSMAAASIHTPSMSPASLFSCSSTPGLPMSPLQDSFKPARRSNLTINTKMCGTASPPMLSPYARPSPSMLSSPPMDGNLRKHQSSSNLHMSSSKIDTLMSESDDSDPWVVPNGSSSASCTPKTMHIPKVSLFRGDNRPDYKGEAINKEIQWVYKKPNSPTSSPSSPRAFNLNTSSSSVVPAIGSAHTAPSTPTSMVNIKFQKLQCRSGIDKDDENVAKSLIGLSQWDHL
eukprot:gene7750-9085_t